MDPTKLIRRSAYEWQIDPVGAMRVPVVLFASEELIREMDEKVREQAMHVAELPGIQTASYTMPDAHWGYGFPIGGVAAFDSDEDGVISAGGVGFDISCGVRTMTTGLKHEEVENRKTDLANTLFKQIPAGVGSTGKLHLNLGEMDEMLSRGAAWAVAQGYGMPEDLERIEENGCMPGALPHAVSSHAKERQFDEMGTLGSGNHYLEVQVVKELFDTHTAKAYGLDHGDVVVTIHCGSRGLGHQIGTDYLKEMVMAAASLGLTLPDRELACAPINSELGRNYLGAMRAGVNCAFANHQILSHLTRNAFAHIFAGANLKLLYDVSHNTCKVEEHQVLGATKPLFVHRKGATRAFGPGHPTICASLRNVGQPVLIGGSMGTCSYVLAGTEDSERHAFSSAVHGAGRAMSRHRALQTWQGRQIMDALAKRGIIIRCPSTRGVAEEAPGAYKDVSAVVDAADHAGLAKKIARLEPIICIKG